MYAVTMITIKGLILRCYKIVTESLHVFVSPSLNEKLLITAKLHTFVTIQYYLFWSTASIGIICMCKFIKFKKNYLRCIGIWFNFKFHFLFNVIFLTLNMTYFLFWCCLYLESRYSWKFHLNLSRVNSKSVTDLSGRRIWADDVLVVDVDVVSATTYRQGLLFQIISMLVPQICAQLRVLATKTLTD